MRPVRSAVALSAVVVPHRAVHNSTFTPAGGGGGSAINGGGGSSSSSPLSIPCSTILTVGDVEMPIPDYVRHPERVSWVMPGADHAGELLLTHAAAAQRGKKRQREVEGTTQQQLISSPLLHPLQGNLFFNLQDPLTRSYVRWMCQKEHLGQDMCLVGDPGPARRWLVMLYSYLTRRETRIVFLNRDVTESDLKQRREIRNGTLVYEDQSAVSAAKEGQLLVLEGLEKVERNVLPVINNLLENREMHLDNGAMLIHHARYDALLQDLIRSKLRYRDLPDMGRSGTGQDALSNQQREDDYRALMAEAERELAGMGLIRVSEKFRVVGITVPVPPYDGNPLDPPLRSRFQCLYMRTPLPSFTALSSTASTAVSRLSATASYMNGGGEGAAAAAGAVDLAAEAARVQKERTYMEQVVKVHTAIEAINAATVEFSGNTAAAAAASGGGGGGTAGQASQKSCSSSSAAAGAAALQNIGGYEMGTVARYVSAFPDLPLGEILVRCFPWPLLARQLPGGRDSTSSVGAEEARKRFGEYASVMHKCELTSPLLLLDHSSMAESRSDGRDNAAAVSSRHPRSSSSSSATASKQAGDALKSMFANATSGMFGAPAASEAVAREFVTSAQLLACTDVDAGLGERDGTGGSGGVEVPTAVAQACNYVQRIENARVLHVGSGDDAGGRKEGNVSVATAAAAATAVVTADAVIASATSAHGSYVIPIFMGFDALSSANLPSSSSHEDGGSGASLLIDIQRSVPSPRSVFTTEHYHILQSMLQAHACNQHMVLIGSTGCGKTALVSEFCRLLGYEAETMHLYADMTSRDLFQRRTTDQRTGNTVWDNSALVDAAIKGKLVVLDGIDHLPPGALGVLQQLLVDQSTNLFDGTVLKPPREFEILKDKKKVYDSRTGQVLFVPTDEDMHKDRIFAIHPAFRVIATARVPGDGSGSGSAAAQSGKGFTLSHEVTTLFSVIAMPETSDRAVEPVLLQVAQRELNGIMKASSQASASGSAAASTLPATAKTMTQRKAATTTSIRKLLQLRSALEELRAADPKIPQLTVRQLLHIVRGAVHWPEHFTQSVAAALLLPLMTGVSATQVRQCMAQCGMHVEAEVDAAEVLVQASSAASAEGARVFMVNGAPVLRITRQYTPHELALVPFSSGFYPNRVHETIIAWLAKQHVMGTNVLLIGNQGVGKNKVVDAFLSRVQLPRHYIQLHRDTTVGSLTINPTVENGQVRWEDSPLVKAVERGHCLVVDEIDKASVEVIQVLKGLIEDREMRLSDGRKIIDPSLLAPKRLERLLARCSRRRAAQVDCSGKEGEGDAETRRKASATTTGEARTAAGEEEGDADADEEEDDDIILIHPDFRIIVLANPPGFPFHGNDFFRECGDLFSSCVLGNPDADSQMRVLRAYAPNIPVPVLSALVNAFATLQAAFAEGILTYPFSLRELIAVVKHVSRYPQDGIYTALNNVFNFDTRDANTLHYVRQVLAQALRPISRAGGMTRVLPLRAGKPQPLATLPDLLSLPLPSNHQEGGADEKEASFAKILDASVLQSPHGLANLLATNTHPAITWKEKYSAMDFAVSEPSTEGFSEWADRLRMPFMRPEQDTVLAMLPVGRFGAVPASSLVTFLVARAPQDTHVGVSQKEQQQQYLLVTAHLPPSTTLDVSIAGSLDGGTSGALAARGWPVGEVHYIDVTELVMGGGDGTAARSPDDIIVEDFNIAPHLSATCGGGLGGKGLVWPPAAAKQQQQFLYGGEEGMVVDAMDAPPVLLMRAGGRVFLVDVMTGSVPADVNPLSVVTSSSEPEAATASSAAPAGKAARSENEQRASNAIVEVPLAALAATTEDVTGVLDATAPEGIVAFSSGKSATLLPSSPSPATTGVLSVLMEGHVVAVTLPGRVACAHFFTSQLALVTLMQPHHSFSSSTNTSAGTAAPQADIVQGVLKVVLSAREAAATSTVDVHASFAYLPKGLGSSIVDVIRRDGKFEEQSDNSGSRSVMLVPSDLEGAVLVNDTFGPSSVCLPAPSSSSTAAATAQSHHTSSSRDVSYSVIESASFSKLSMRVFRAPPQRPNTTSVDTAMTTLVDSVQHQLLETQLVPFPSSSSQGNTGVATSVSVVDTKQGTVRYLDALPGTVSALSVHGEKGTAVAYSGATRELHVADTNFARVQRRYDDWSALLNGSPGNIGDGEDSDGKSGGAHMKDFKMEYSTPRKKPSGSLKHGEVDDKEHHDGNTWAGGTGGTDTAGLGGIIGPYRLDKGNKVYQVSDAEKAAVPEHIKAEARRMGREALQERLKAIGMDEEEYRQYQHFQERVRPSISQLRAVLMGLKAAEGERTWVKGQTDGVWDDQKLVEGIVGERNVFKRRVDASETNPFQQKHKKRVLFVLDVSASMYRFEGSDHRLTRLLESTVMVMEAFAGFEDKIDYAMIGHNGDSAAIPLVNFGAPPANQKERMTVCQKMVAYSQYCWSGDNTVEAMRESIELVTAEKGDAYFVFVISDANLPRYGISPQELSTIIRSRREVQMFCIFIATLGAQASSLQKQLPAGHGFECMQTDELPHILRQIFTSVRLL